MNSQLSEAQLNAMALCRRSGSLWRWRGGYWVSQPPPAEPYESPPLHPWFGTRTIQALINRGKLKVVERCARFDLRVQPENGEGD